MQICQDIMRSMYAYVDGELGASRRSRVQSHLRECARCRDAFTIEDAFLELLRFLFASRVRSDDGLPAITEDTEDRPTESARASAHRPAWPGEWTQGGAHGVPSV